MNPAWIPVAAACVGATAALIGSVTTGYISLQIQKRQLRHQQLEDKRKSALKALEELYNLIDDYSKRIITESELLMICVYEKRPVQRLSTDRKENAYVLSKILFLSSLYLFNLESVGALAEMSNQENKVKSAQDLLYEAYEEKHSLELSDQVKEAADRLATQAEVFLETCREAQRTVIDMARRYC